MGDGQYTTNFLITDHDLWLMCTTKGDFLNNESIRTRTAISWLIDSGSRDKSYFPYHSPFQATPKVSEAENKQKKKKKLIA